MRILFVVLLVFLLTIPQLPAETINASGIWVTDGDTFCASLPDKNVVVVRLAGIDAPELNQPWGKVARSALIAMVVKRKISVTRTGNSYNRIVAKVDRSGTDIAMVMLKMGLAWVDRKYSISEEYQNAEAEARTAKRGLWSEKKPIPPWEWRKKDNASKKE